MGNLKRNADIRISKELMQRLNISTECIDWWCRNGLEGFKVKSLIEAKGDFKGYIATLKDVFDRSRFDERDNQISYTGADGVSWEKTYDPKRNVLMFRDSNHYYIKKTYDLKGNVLTFDDANGESWSRTYDSRGNVALYEDSRELSIRMLHLKADKGLVVAEDGAIILTIMDE